MGLPKVVLASINMSSGGKLKSQCMPMWFQQERLKGHSKNRCMQVSSTLLLLMTQLQSSRYVFFLLSKFLVFSLSLRSNKKKRIYACPDYQQTTSRRREGRQLLYLECTCMPFWMKIYWSSRYRSKYQQYPHPSHAFAAAFLELLILQMLGLIGVGNNLHQGHGSSSTWLSISFSWQTSTREQVFKTVVTPNISPEQN